MNFDPGSKSFQKTMEEMAASRVERAEDERKLWEEYDASGDEAIPERILTSSLWYIGWLAGQQYSGRGVDVGDLFSVGAEEVRRAMPHYIKNRLWEGERPCRLASYAMPSVRERMGWLLAKFGTQIRLPVSESLQAKRFKSLDEEEVEGREGQTLLKDQLPDDKLPNPSLEAEKDSYKRGLSDRLDSILEGSVIKAFYGIDRVYPKTLDELEQEGPLSRNEVKATLEEGYHHILHPTVCVIADDYEKGSPR